MRLISLILLTGVLSSCASIDLAEVEPEKLKADVSVLQTPRSVDVDLYLSRGLFGQPVRLNTESAEIVTQSGARTALSPARQAGRYGVRLDGNDAPSTLMLESVGDIRFPEMTPLRLGGKRAVADERLYRDDRLTLSLPDDSSAPERYLVVTAQCGDQTYTAERRLEIDNRELSVSADELVRMANRAAEADLNGIIPVELAVEERYQPQWPAPFRVRSIAVRDSTRFTVDTSGFRFQAKVQVQVAEGFFFSFQNQAWPVQYCF